MITDEMVEVAERARYSACKLPYAAMRLGLEAVMPMIRDAALEEAAMVAEYRDPTNPFAPRDDKGQRIAAAIRAMQGDKP